MTIIPADYTVHQWSIIGKIRDSCIKEFYETHGRLVIHRPQDVLSRATCEPEREGSSVGRQAQVRIWRVRMDDGKIV